jgi:hypothetical protein
MEDGKMKRWNRGKKQQVREEKKKMKIHFQEISMMAATYKVRKK